MLMVITLILLELSFFRKDIISFRPNSKKQFIGQKLGATNDAVNIEQLNLLIEKDTHTYTKLN